jgi:hypothetical protein
MSICLLLISITYGFITYVFIENYLSSLSGTQDPLRMATICRNMSGQKNIWNIKISTTSWSICWSFYKRYYTMLGSTIKTINVIVCSDFVGAFEYSRIASPLSCQSVCVCPSECPSARIYQLGSHWTDFRYI